MYLFHPTDGTGRSTLSSIPVLNRQKPWTGFQYHASAQAIMKVTERPKIYLP